MDARHRARVPSALPRLRQHADDVWAGIPLRLELTALADRAQGNHAAAEPEMIVVEASDWRAHGRARSQRDRVPGRRQSRMAARPLRRGGEGTTPSEGPRPAGGIGPDNGLDVLRRIDATGPFGIDVESELRTGDGLDFGTCEAVC